MYIEPFIIIIILLIVLRLLGRASLILFGCSENFHDLSLLIGFCITTLFFSLYTILNVKIFHLVIFWLTLLFLLLLFVMIKKNGIKIFILKIDGYSWASTFTPLIIFFFICIIYGINFIVFRGNIWDWFNYNTMAVAYSKYTPNELYNLIEQGNHLSYIASLNLNQRPAVVLFPSAILSWADINSFALMYLYKGFLLSIFSSTTYWFLKESGVKKFISFLYTLCITFSMWITYSIETDALSQIGHLIFIPFILGYLEKFKNFENNSDNLLFSMVLASSFIIYPEFGSIIIFTILILLNKFIWNFNDSLKKNIIKITCLTAPFILIEIFLYEQSIKFLFKQLINGFTAKMDWWGYYGSYLLGPDSPVTDDKLVAEIKTALNSSVDRSSFISILWNQTSSYIINVLPSVFGMFHVLSYKILIYPTFIITLALLFLLLKWYLFKGNIASKWLKITVLTVFSLVLLLVIRGNYWSAVKGLSYLITLIPFTLTYIISETRLKNYRLIPILILIIAPIFFFYKYSTYNYGIGVYDGFPSILHRDQKEKIDWTFNVDDYKNCNLVAVDIKDHFYRHYIILNLENSKINYKVKSNLQESYGVGRIISEADFTGNFDCYLVK